MGDSAERFVKRLLKDGGNFLGDENNAEFINAEKLPPFYDGNLYKKGRKFYNDNLFAICYSGLLATLSTFTIPSLRNILIHTKKSGSQFAAYKRYVATHLLIAMWYEENMKPGSRFWRSMYAVRKMHRSASNSGNKRGLGGITQKDMVLTQVANISFVLVRSENIGIHNPTEEDLKAFIHVWRVIGYLLGIEDRFNACRESVEETKEICRLIIEEVFHPEMQKREADFLSISQNFLRGLWIAAPYLNYKSVMCVFDNITREHFEDMSEPVYFKLNCFQRIHYWVFTNYVYLLQYNVLKIFSNLCIMLNVWLMEYCPVIAYYFYGIKDGTVHLDFK